MMVKNDVAVPLAAVKFLVFLEGFVIVLVLVLLFRWGDDGGFEIRRFDRVLLR